MVQIATRTARIPPARAEFGWLMALYAENHARLSVCSSRPTSCPAATNPTSATACRCTWT